SNLVASLTIFWQMGDKGNIPDVLDGFSGLLIRQGNLEQAARLYGATDNLREVTGTPVWPVDLAQYKHDVAFARAQLGEVAFARAYQDGQAIGFEQAVTYALNLV